MVCDLLRADGSVLLVIDMQEKFIPVIRHAEHVVHACKTLIQAAKHLDVPIVVTEQYPQGLGSTVDELASELPESAHRMEKTAFGCCDEAGFNDLLASCFAGKSGSRQVVVCGIEAHVCVNQTVIRLLQQGYEVFLVADAIGARHKDNLKVAMKKLIHQGAIASCVEMALFEWMKASTHPQFKTVQALVK